MGFALETRNCGRPWTESTDTQLQINAHKNTSEVVPKPAMVKVEEMSDWVHLVCVYEYVEGVSILIPVDTYRSLFSLFMSGNNVDIDSFDLRLKYSRYVKKKHRTKTDDDC